MSIAFNFGITLQIWNILNEILNLKFLIANFLLGQTTQLFLWKSGSTFGWARASVFYNFSEKEQQIWIVKAQINLKRLMAGGQNDSKTGTDNISKVILWKYDFKVPIDAEMLD